MKKLLLFLLMSISVMSIALFNHDNTASANDVAYNLYVEVEDHTVTLIKINGTTYSEGDLALIELHFIIDTQYSEWWVFDDPDYILNSDLYEGTAESQSINEVKYISSNNNIRISSSWYYIFLTQGGYIVPDELVMSDYIIDIDFYELPRLQSPNYDLVEATPTSLEFNIQNPNTDTDVSYNYTFSKDIGGGWDVIDSGSILINELESDNLLFTDLDDESIYRLRGNFSEYDPIDKYRNSIFTEIIEETLIISDVDKLTVSIEYASHNFADLELYNPHDYDINYSYVARIDSPAQTVIGSGSGTLAPSASVYPNVTVNNDYDITISIGYSAVGYHDVDEVLTFQTPKKLIFNYNADKVDVVNVFALSGVFYSDPYWYVLPNTVTEIETDFNIGFEFIEYHIIDQELGFILIEENPFTFTMPNFDLDITVVTSGFTYPFHISYYLDIEVWGYEYMVSPANLFTMGRLSQATIIINDEIIVDNGKVIKPAWFYFEIGVNYFILMDEYQKQIRFFGNDMFDSDGNKIVSRGTVFLVQPLTEYGIDFDLEIHLPYTDPNPTFALPTITGDLNMPSSFVYLLESLNLISIEGFLLIAVIIIVLGNAYLLYAGFDTTTIVVVDILLLGFMAFMNILPFWALFVMSLLLLFSLIYLFKGGLAHE